MKIPDLKQGKMDGRIFLDPQLRLWKMTSRANVGLVDASQNDLTAVKSHPVVPGKGYSRVQGSRVSRRTFVSTITLWGGYNFPSLGSPGENPLDATVQMGVYLFLFYFLFALWSWVFSVEIGGRWSRRRMIKY
jgi:hypothetical protein